MANAFSIRTLGLNPDWFQLTAFLAAAGLDDLADADKPGGTPTIVVCSGELVENVCLYCVNNYIFSHH